MSHPPVLRRLAANGITLAAFEWRPECRGHGPTLLLVHATGFHGRVWDEVVRQLPGRHVIAIEQRGHGRSDKTPFVTWEDFGRDLAAAAVALDLQGAVAVGHSMGGHALVQAASFEPARFAQLMLIDPVLLAPEVYLHGTPPPETLHPAVHRKNHFPSVQAMVERFADRVPYSAFTPQALQDYCEHGLVPRADGDGFELACPPTFEGRVYPNARHVPGVYASIRALRIPVTVLRARDADPSITPFDTLGSPTWPGLAGEFRQGRDIHLNDKTHLVPMEDPALVAGLIEDTLFGGPVKPR